MQWGWETKKTKFCRVKERINKLLRINLTTDTYNYFTETEDYKFDIKVNTELTPDEVDEVFSTVIGSPIKQDTIKITRCPECNTLLTVTKGYAECLDDRCKINKFKPKLINKLTYCYTLKGKWIAEAKIK